LFVRAMPTHAMTPILAMEHTLVARGNLEEMSDTAATADAPLAEAALFAARFLWSEF